MEDKYRVIKEHIKEMELRKADVKHYEDMFERYEQIIAENDTEIKQGELNSVIKDMDSFIENFIEIKKAKIEKELSKYREKYGEINDELNSMKAELILGEELDADVVDYVGVFAELEENMKELTGEANRLIVEIDAFKKLLSYHGVVRFVGAYKGITEAIAILKTKITKIKQHQVDMYNSTVSKVNKDILSLKKIEGLSEELTAKINGLVELSTVNVTVGNSTQIKYFEKLDFVKLKQVALLILEIQKEITKEMKIEFVDAVVNDIDANMDWIETKVNELQSMLKEEMTVEDIAKLEQEIINLSNRIVEFNIKLNENKDKFNLDKYNEILSRISDAEANITDLALELNKKKVNQKVFVRIKNNLNSLDQEIVDLKFIVDSLYGKILADAALVYEGKLDLFEGRLQEIKNTIEEEYKNGKLDVNQYNQLNKIVEEVEKQINEIREEVRKPEMFRNVDIFSFLNGQIDGLETAIAVLNDKIGDKPIKDRKVRKEIDKQFNAIEKEIKNIEKDLEKYKEEDTEKYEATKERLEQVKDKLDKLGKKYRKNCPLLVRTVKSAKAFYKKHKKICLTIAGLAAFSLVSYHVLIPAIIHGNLMIGATAPALSGFTGFVNNVLGGLIGAHEGTAGFWYLANGVRLNSAAAATSLLKGIAISGISTAALITPIVMGVKKVSHKMKLAELKEKIRLSELKEKMRFKKKSDEEKEPSNKEPGKLSVNKAYKKVNKTLDSLLREYHKSKGEETIDEFCAKRGFPDAYKAILQVLDEQFNENINKSGRGK